MVSRSSASSCRTNAAAAPAIRRATVAVDSSGAPATTGSHGRRACLAASRAVAAHFSRARTPRSPRHWATERDAAQGTISSTPTSVIACTASSPRSPLAMPCTTTMRGTGASAYPREVMVTVEAAPADGGDHGGGRAAPAVGEQQLLADPQPLHGRGVVPLRAVQGERVAGGQRVDQEQRRGHLRRGR